MVELEVLDGRVRFRPVLGHVQREEHWVARLANTVEAPDGRLVTIEIRGDRAEVAEDVLAAGCWIMASGRWMGDRFDVDRFALEGEDPRSERRYRLTEAARSARGAVSARSRRTVGSRGRDPLADSGDRPFAAGAQSDGEGPAFSEQDRRAGGEERVAPSGDIHGSERAEPPIRVHGRRPDDGGVIRI